MKKEVQIAVCMQEQDAIRVQELLHIWAEEICVSIKVEIMEFALLLENVDLYSMLLIDSCGMSAAELVDLQSLREKKPSCGLILLVDDDRTAIDVYPCHPNALVPKPVTYSGLDAAMERCFLYWQRGQSWLDLPLQHKRVRIPLYQLYYAEAAGRNTILYRAGGELQVNCSLSALEEQLPHPPFLRCQKSFLIHLGAIEKVIGGELVMCNSRVVPVARTRIRQVNQELAHYRQMRGAEEEAK